MQSRTPRRRTPTGLAATAASERLPGRLTWTASSDDVGVTGCDVFRDGSKIATVSTPGYADTTVTSGVTYTYTVKARDASGNVSGAGNAASVTPGSTSANSLTFIPEADARVDEAAPDTNYGASYLRVNGGSQPDMESYLRFTVSGVTGTVKSARLQLWVTNGTVDGPAVFSASGGLDRVHHHLAKSPCAHRHGCRRQDGGAGRRVDGVRRHSLVTGDGTRTFVLATTSTDGIEMTSREGSNASQRPQLVLTWE